MRGNWHKVLISLWGVLLVHSAYARVPEVLFIGDPIQQKIFQEAAGALPSKVSVKYITRVPAYDCGTVLENWDAVIGDKNWDLIYFNFGIADLVHKDPSTKEIRVMSRFAGGVRVSSPEQYRINLEEVVKRLKALDVKILWGNTTPLVELSYFPAYTGPQLLDENSEIEYNARAQSVMKRNQIDTVDLHGYIMSHYPKAKKHPGFAQYVDDFKKRKIAIGSPFVKAFTQALGL